MVVVDAVVRLLHPTSPEAPVVVRHDPTGQFLGPGLELVDGREAVEFPSAREARRFLERFASEPCHRVVPLELALRSA